MTVFRAYVNGYTFSTTNLNLMQMWIDARKLDCKGHTLRLHQGKRRGNCDVFAANCFTRVSVL